MKDDNLAVVNQSSNTNIRLSYVVSTIIQSRFPAEVGADPHRIELPVMNEMQVLPRLFSQVTAASTNAHNIVEELKENENPGQAELPIEKSDKKDIILEEILNQEKKEEPEEILSADFSQKRQSSYLESDFNFKLNSELEEFHQSLLLAALRGNPALSINSLLEIFFETEEEKLLESQLQRYEFQLMALKIRQTLIDNLLLGIDDSQQFCAMTKSQSQKRLNEAKPHLAEIWKGLQRDYFYDEYGKLHILNNDACQSLLGFCEAYIDYCVAQFISLFQEQEKANSLEALYTELQAQQVCCSALIEENLQLCLKQGKELRGIQDEREQRYNTQLSLIHALNTRNDNASLYSFSEGSFSDEEIFNIDMPIEFVSIPKLPPLPSTYQYILSAKTFKNLENGLPSQPELWLGMDVHQLSNFLSKLAELTPKNCMLPEQMPFYLELASLLPESLYLPLPAQVQNQPSNLQWFHPTKLLKPGILYIYITKTSVIFKALRAGDAQKSTVRCELTETEINAEFGEGVFKLFKDKASPWARYDDEAQKTPFAWINDAWRKKLFELVMERCELVNDFTDLEELLKTQVKEAHLSLQALSSAKLWIANNAKKLELVKKFLLLKCYLPKLDINGNYKNKTLLQRVCDQEPLNYYLIVHLLLLGASTKDLPECILRDALGLVNWVTAIEGFRQRKIMNMLTHSSQDPDFSRLSQQWTELRNSTIDNPKWQVLRKNAAGIPEWQNNTISLHHLFPEDCLRAAAALQRLLQTKKADERIPEFYQQMWNIYENLTEAAEQSKRIKGHDDLLFSRELKMTIEKVANHWWKKTPTRPIRMPNDYRKWFKQLKEPYKKALKALKSLSPKSTRPQFNQIGQAIPYSLRSDSELFLKFLQFGYDSIESGRNELMSVLSEYRQELIRREQQVIDLKGENDILKGQIATILKDKIILEGKVDVLTNQVARLLTFVQDKFPSLNDSAETNVQEKRSSPSTSFFSGPST